jgi:hypothetical protein
MYVIYNVTADAGPLEPMGSKPKFWFEHELWGACLFKAARPGSGEDWSEKLAEQFASQLGIPHARYEMAQYMGENGVVTPRITGEEERLIHGNELLIELDPGYDDGSRRYRTPRHTVVAVFEALSRRAVRAPRGFEPPSGVVTCGDVLTGYLLLDALIGNTDRHHENWAVVEDSTDAGEDPALWLCPTFDHASSLGRNESQERMRQRLETRDAGYTVEAYAARAKSAIYSSSQGDQPLTPVEAFQAAAVMSSAGARAWCERLSGLDDDTVRGIVSGVPDERMPSPAKEFVVRMIRANKAQLEETCRSL